MRTKGYAAFSYADLAKCVGIRKASIHHHFPTKEALGVAIVESYVAKVRMEFDRIENIGLGVHASLRAFFEYFQASAGGSLLPLCGALAAEMSALPEELRKMTRLFFEMQLDWLTSMLDKGITKNEIPAGKGARQKAFALLSFLEGSSFVVWATDQGDRLDDSMLSLVIDAA